MAQVFHPSTNTISRVSIVGAVLAVLGVSGAIFAANLTYGNRLHVPIEQPVQFSHKHHVVDDGIDCRYCHTSVDKANFAGLPPTETCMTCHSKIWSDSPLLEPVRESFRTGKPIQWTRVHDLPDFVYFNHAVHVKKGVGCVSCHGRVDEMPITWKQNTMTMGWCIDCHRNPAKNLRPQDRIFSMDWQPPAKSSERAVLAQALVAQYHILPVMQLTNCSICHH
ncbi:MAG TPA: cytochrome c3 family protein [Armatimonadota bacterium]|jgi:hypothetical protein